MISIKSKSEIEIMREGGRILAAAFEKVREAAKPGVTTQELDSLVE